MKTLIIPVADSNKIDISEINRDFHGLIIGYLENKPIGYVVYYDSEWYFRNSIDEEDCCHTEDYPIDLIKYLISNRICDNFKVIEFHES